MRCCLQSGPVSREDSVQFFCPFPVRTFQSLFKNIDHGLDHGFGLSVRLEVSKCGEGKLYASVLEELIEVVACELPFSVTISWGTRIERLRLSIGICGSECLLSG